MNWLRRPSPALLLAMLALIVALAGSAGADPVATVSKAINGAKIKKHSIQLDALSPDAVKALQGTTNVTVVKSQCGPAPCQTASVTCPAGTHEVGGGGLAVGNQLLFESAPTQQSGTPTGWSVAGGAADPPVQGVVAAYALCASP